MSDSPPTPDLRETTKDYDVMLEQLDESIDQIIYKLNEGRLNDIEREKVRIKYMRCLGYLIRTKQDIVEDKTLEELADEVERLKEERERAQYR